MTKTTLLTKNSILALVSFFAITTASFADINIRETSFNALPVSLNQTQKKTDLLDFPDWVNTQELE